MASIYRASRRIIRSGGAASICPVIQPHLRLTPSSSTALTRAAGGARFHQVRPLLILTVWSMWYEHRKRTRLARIINEIKSNTQDGVYRSYDKQTDQSVSGIFRYDKKTDQYVRVEEYYKRSKEDGSKNKSDINNDDDDEDTGNVDDDDDRSA